MYKRRAFEPPPFPSAFGWLFQGGTSVAVSQCYMLLCLCVYGLQRYGHMYNSCPLCFQFCSVL